MDTQFHTASVFIQIELLPVRTESICTDSALLALGVCLAHGAFDIIGIGRLCASNRALRQQIMAQLAGSNMLSMELLVRTTKQASCGDAVMERPPSCRLPSELNVKSPDQVQTLAQAVEWLLSKANMPQQLIVQSTQRFVSIPRTPLAIAKVLVAAGIRVTNEQLLSAADNRLEGFHRWVAAQQQLAINSDIPAAVEAVCCLELHGWRAPQLNVHHVNAEELSNLFVIALNTLPADPKSIKRVAGSLCAAPAAGDINLDTAKHLFATAARLCTARELQWCIGPLLQGIARLPALEPLSAADIKLLWQEAVHEEELSSLEASQASVRQGCQDPADPGNRGDCTSSQKLMDNKKHTDIQAQLKEAALTAIELALESGWQPSWGWRYVSVVIEQLSSQGPLLDNEHWPLLFKMYAATMNSGFTDSTTVCASLSGLFTDPVFRTAIAAMPVEAVSKLLDLAVGASNKDVALSAVHCCLNGILGLTAVNHSAGQDWAKGAEQLVQHAVNNHAWDVIICILQSRIGNSVSSSVKGCVVARMLRNAVYRECSYIREMDSHLVSVLARHPILMYLDLTSASELVKPRAAIRLFFSVLKSKAHAVRELSQGLGQEGQLSRTLEAHTLAAPVGQTDYSVVAAELSFVIDAIAKLMRCDALVFHNQILLAMDPCPDKPHPLDMTACAAEKILREVLAITCGTHHEALLRVLEKLFRLRVILRCAMIFHMVIVQHVLGTIVIISLAIFGIIKK